MNVRHVRPSDAPAWLRLRRAFWPDGSEGEHANEIAADNPLRFAELSIHPYAEGCHTGRVAYLEGWYVVPEARSRGIGRALIAAAQDWGRSLGCTEFASDAELTNDISAAAHRALGFVEVGQIRCFRKDL